MSLLAQDERLTRRVGAIALLLVAASILFVVFLLDRIEIGTQVRVRVYMRATGGLRVGAPLIVGGRAIGKIERIAQSPHGAPGPLGGDEGVVLTVTIDEDDAERIQRGGDVFVASRGVLSERYLEMGPASEPGPPLNNGDEFLGKEPPSMDRVMQRTWDNLTTMRRFLEDVQPEMDALRVQLAALGDNVAQVSPVIAGVPSLALEIEGLMSEARAAYAAIGGEPGLDRIDAVITRARATLVHARRMIDQLDAQLETLVAATGALRARAGDRGTAAIAAVELAIDRMRAAIDKIDPLLAKVEEIQSRLARGEGSVGRLMKDPEFPEDAKELGKILKRQPWKIMARPKD